jgi:hypothetical protein
LHYQDKQTTQFQIEVSIGPQPFSIKEQVTFPTTDVAEDASLVGGVVSIPQTLSSSLFEWGWYLEAEKQKVNG